MENFILDTSEKKSYIRYLIEVAQKTTEFTSLYNDNDRIFAGQTYVYGSFYSVLILKQAHWQNISSHVKEIQQAMTNSILSWFKVIVYIEPGEFDLEELYKRSLSFYSINEHVRPYREVNDIQKSVEAIKDLKTMTKGFYPKDNFAMIRYTPIYCPDCDKDLFLPYELYALTADQYSEYEKYKQDDLRESYIHTLRQRVEMYLLKPTATIPLYDFDDSLFLQMRSYFRNRINPGTDTPYNDFAQPILTNDNDRKVPFICPHCMSQVAVADRQGEQLIIADGQEFEKEYSCVDFLRLSYQPEFIYTYLNKKI